MAGQVDSLYLSNLSYDSTEDSLRGAFPKSIRAQIVRDRENGRSKGFGFIQFESPEEAQGELDRCGGAGGTVSIDGRDIKINYAHS